MAGKVFKQDEDARRRVMGGRIESGKPEAGRSFYCRIELDEGSKYSKDVMGDIRKQMELNLNTPSNAKDSGGVFGESEWKSNRIMEGGEAHYYSDLSNMGVIADGFREAVQSRSESAREGTDEILKDFLKDNKRMSEVMSGVVIGRATGAQPVFVTNWPGQTLQNIAAISEIWGALSYLSSRKGSLVYRLIGLGAAEAAGGAALAETTVAGGAAAGGVIGPAALGLAFFGGGYAIGTGINKGLGAALGIEDRPGTKWYEGGIGGRLGEIHHDIRSNGGYLDNAGYFYGRNVVEPVNKWMESVSPKVGGILFRNLGFSVGETDEGTYPNPIRDYAAQPEGMEENVSDIFRRERIVRIENAPPEIKNQNKVNLLINLYEDGRSYVETDLNTEPKIDFRRGYMD